MANYSKKPNRRVPFSSKIHTNDLSVSYCISSFETIILSERHWCKIVHELHLRKTQTMKRFHTILILSICIGLPTALFGQGYVSSEYLSSSSLRDEAGGRFGSGAMWRFSGRYTLPLSVKRNDRGQPVAWSATFNCTYASLQNEGVAAALNPDRILNTSLNVSHLRPISERWSLIASLGCGIYAVPSQIAWRSILANGAVIFVYKLRENLDIGVGAGLTNSFGVPMILPMGYLNWRTSGKYEIRVDMSSGLKVTAAKWLNRKFKLELTAIEMDGISSVMRIGGKSKIYSSTMMRSTLSPTFCISPKASVYFGIGGNWLRSIRISDRDFGGFLDSFREDGHDFGVSLRVTAGFNWSF